ARGGAVREFPIGGLAGCGPAPVGAEPAGGGRDDPVRRAGIEGRDGSDGILRRRAQAPASAARGPGAAEASVALPVGRGPGAGSRAPIRSWWSRASLRRLWAGRCAFS